MNDIKTHTPGPWVCQELPSVALDGRSNLVLRTIHGGSDQDVLVSNVYNRDDDATAAANACLIAAAPEMLDALRTLVRATENSGIKFYGIDVFVYGVDPLEAARAALAKAEGKS